MLISSLRRNFDLFRTTKLQFSLLRRLFFPSFHFQFHVSVLFTSSFHDVHKTQLESESAVRLSCASSPTSILQTLNSVR